MEVLMYDLTMQNAHRLAIVRSLHAESVIAMALSKFVLFYGGVISAVGVWLWVAVTLIAIEVVAFVGNGMGVSADGSRRAVWPDWSCLDDLRICALQSCRQEARRRDSAAKQRRYAARKRAQRTIAATAAT